MLTIKNLLILFSCFIGLGILGYILIKVLIPEASITSWWRTPKHNTEVGGAWNSIHQFFGWAYDVIPVNSDVYNKLSKIFPNPINEGDHIHVSWLGC